MKWLLVVGTVVCVAAWLSPIVTPFAKQWGWVSDAPEKASSSFLKVFRRLLLLPLVALVLLRLRPWRDGGPAVYGLVGPNARMRPALVAFLVTLLAGALLVIAEVALNWFVPEQPASVGSAFSQLGKRLMAGLVVALLEECFFRGWMQRRLEGRTTALRAALWVALLFASLHAFRPSNLRAEVEGSALGALGALWSWIRVALDPAAFGPTFAGLFLFSLVLEAVRRRTGTLWTAIAVHAAAVWVAYGHEVFTNPGRAPAWAGGNRLVDGLPALLMLGVAVAVLWPRTTGTKEGIRESGPS